MVFHLALKAVKEWYFVTKHMLRCYSWVRHCSEVISEGLDSHGRSTSGRRAGRCCASQRWWCGKAGSYLMEFEFNRVQTHPCFWKLQNDDCGFKSNFWIFLDGVYHIWSSHGGLRLWIYFTPNRHWGPVRRIDLHPDSKTQNMTVMTWGVTRSKTQNMVFWLVVSNMAFTLW